MDGAGAPSARGGRKRCRADESSGFAPRTAVSERDEVAESSGWCPPGGGLLCSAEAVNARAEAAIARIVDAVPPGMPQVVSFSVSGEQIDVSLPTLRKEPASLLYRLAIDHYRHFRGREGEPHAAAAHPLPRHGTTPAAASAPQRLPPIVLERDPALFRMVLNLLRGYRTLSADGVFPAAGTPAVLLPSSAAPSMFLERFDEFTADCEYYGIGRARIDALFPPPCSPRFVGPGSSGGGKRLGCSTIVSVLELDAHGGSFRGAVEAWFRVEVCDGPRGVLLGVVPAGLDNLAADPTSAASAVRHCAMLSSSGDVSHTFGGPSDAAVAVTAEEACGGFYSGAVVHVLLDPTRRRVSWGVAAPCLSAAEGGPANMPEHVVKVLQLPAAAGSSGDDGFGRLALAAVISRGSQVQVLPPQRRWCA